MIDKIFKITAYCKYLDFMGMLDMVDFKGTRMSDGRIGNVTFKDVRIDGNNVIHGGWGCSLKHDKEADLSLFIAYLNTTFELPKEELHETLLKIMILNQNTTGK